MHLTYTLAPLKTPFFCYRCSKKEQQPNCGLQTALFLSSSKISRYLEYITPFCAQLSIHSLQDIKRFLSSFLWLSLQLRTLSDGARLRKPLQTFQPSGGYFTVKDITDRHTGNVSLWTFSLSKCQRLYIFAELSRFSFGHVAYWRSCGIEIAVLLPEFSRRCQHLGHRSFGQVLLSACVKRRCHAGSEITHRRSVNPAGNPSYAEMGMSPFIPKPNKLICFVFAVL